MSTTPAITAPDVVVHTWREEATRALHASLRADDPHLVDVLRFVPRELGELVACMSEALSHAAGILLASVANAMPPGEACPIPDPGGAAYPCRCEPEFRVGCEATVAELAPAVAGDGGGEGGVA